MVLDLALLSGGEIFELPAGGLKGVADSDVDVIVRIGNVGIPADYNIRGFAYRKMDPHLIGIALMVPVLWPADDRSRRRNAV